jgi:predicted RecB family endonuclease
VRASVSGRKPFVSPRRFGGIAEQLAEKLKYVYIAVEEPPFRAA